MIVCGNMGIYQVQLITISNLTFGHLPQLITHFKKGWRLQNTVKVTNLIFKTELCFFLLLSSF